MLENPDVSVAGVSETPWGLPWAALFTSLRPTRSHMQFIDSIIEQIRLALARANIEPDRFLAGGPAGRGTQSAGDMTLELYAVFSEGFQARTYVDAYLQPFIAALKLDSKAPFSNIEENGLSVLFHVSGVDVRLFAAGELYAGAKELLLPPSTDANTVLLSASPSNAPEKPEIAGGGANAILSVREVHVQTTCAVMRTEFLAMQPRMYKDMVRVARKWRDSLKYTRTDSVPCDLLLELVMLEAFQGAPAARASADAYAAVFRRFLALLASQSAADGALAGAVDQPATFLAWTTLYNRGAIDHCVAHRMLHNHRGDAHLCVLDPAAPFIDVADTVADWTETRRFARDSLVHFQNTELVEALQAKLNHFSVSVEETLNLMRERIENLQNVEASPRRWSGNIQFNEVHLSTETWSRVFELELRCLKWRINVRRARSDTTGYARTADVSLQIIGLKERLRRTIDVDVHFQGHTAQLVYGPECDHVLIAKRSEILRNRDYAMQITIVA